MTKEELATEIVKDLDLGDHPWNDVYSITLGKLKDRSVHVYNTIGEGRIRVQIAYVMKRFLTAKPAIIVETAKYYQDKYGIEV